MARPTDYTEQVADRICAGLIDGRSLRQICQDDGMPGKQTVFDWLERHEGFRTKYARAREMQADVMDDLILETAEKCSNETYNADRVKIGAYQWRAAKLAPKKYGERITQSHEGKIDTGLAEIMKLISDNPKRLPSAE